MRSSNGYSRTVSALNSLLNSLNERDKIAAVLFTKKAIIYPGNEKTGFLFATDATKSSLLDWILSLFVQTSSTTNSGSYHTAAFETSFAFLKQYSSSLINCDTSLVVFGDADNIKDESNPVNSLLTQYQSLSNYLGTSFVKKVRVFSFSVGIQKGQANPLKSYPCLTGGLWIPLDPSDASTEQSSDVRGLMSPFFSFHSYRRLGKNDIIWSNFYSDLLGIGNMTTASLPCYSSGGMFLGVVGVDVPATLFNTTTYPDAHSEFSRRKVLSDGVGYCPDVDIQDSFVDDLRGGACNYCNQPCGNLAVMLGFIPAVLVAFVVFVIVSFYFYKRSLMKAEGDDEKEEKALVK
ncbi:predicted protein [Naegleria gruberi]|uniref:Predicted protein n=1 Tax=Naegleria gruberi TaxID=5762 RepID=D2W5X9_NAEGR|nr:uncharacterized protein NAEGRDRAFT_54870 [Naegleria gruberi]EFC35523.1 predicted protein [Naegleria gruberi]|eukprot:XP_002668267.1 predicted protein [Naegleria gruberi strain NEG-M]